MSLHSTLPTIHAHHADGPVLRLTMPTQGQQTLSAIHDSSVDLSLLIFYALANPKLGLNRPSNTRLDDEQFHWHTPSPGTPNVATPRVQVVREVLPTLVDFFFFLLDPHFDINLAISNAIQEEREHPSSSSSEWRRRIDAITSQAYYIENTLAPHSPSVLHTGHCTLLDLYNPNNPANVCNILGIHQHDLFFPLGAQIMPVLYQHPNVQLYLDLSSSLAWREGLSDEQATEQCKQAAWAPRDN